MAIEEQNLADCLKRIAQAQPKRIIISNPRTKGESSFVRVEIIRTAQTYQITKRTETQAFHEKTPGAGLIRVLEKLMPEFLQLNALTDEKELRLRLTKKDKVQFGEQKLTDTQKSSVKNVPMEHNRQKNYLIPQGVVVPALVDMGILSRDGHVIQSMYHKYKQINRFLEMVADALQDENNGEDEKEFHVLDFGCGKSYLTFILYFYLTKVRNMQVQMTGLDLKADVVAKCNAAAKRYGYKNLHFEVGDINGYQCTQPVDMVVTLHACDTATDYALFNAIEWGARMIFSVPCCQHELNSQMKSEDFAILTRYGIVQERTAALMTDALRANLLQACGYKTQLLEFIDMEHTPKNVLIRALLKQTPLSHRRKVLQEAQRLMRAFSFQPTLYKLLESKNYFAMTDTGKVEE